MWRESVEPEIDYVVSLDVAQGGPDFTALSVLERTTPMNGASPTFRVSWLERWRDRRTARIAERTRATWQQLAQVHRDREFERTGRGCVTDPPIRLVIDITGSGPFIVDPLREAGFDPIGILITGGSAVTRGEGNVYRVPKSHLASVVAVALEQDRLRIMESLPDAATLRAELENFRVKVNLDTGHASYAAGTDELWRSGAHDDIALSVAIGLWLGESQPVSHVEDWYPWFQHMPR